MSAGSVGLDPVTVTLLAVRALEELEVPCFIGGSLASSAHGAVRSSLDADVIADLQPQHAEPLTNALFAGFYVDLEAVRLAIQQHRSFNIIHRETFFKVDVFVRKPRAFDDVQFERRVAQIVATEPERTAHLATAEDTILAKLEWYRNGGEVSERQWIDVLGVLRTQGDRLDYDYLRHWAHELGIGDLLALALTEAQ